MIQPLKPKCEFDKVALVGNPLGFYIVGDQLKRESRAKFYPFRFLNPIAPLKVWAEISWTQSDMFGRLATKVSACRIKPERIESFEIKLFGIRNQYLGIGKWCQVERGQCRGLRVLFDGCD